MFLVSAAAVGTSRRRCDIAVALFTTHAAERRGKANGASESHAVRAARAAQHARRYGAWPRSGPQVAAAARSAPAGWLGASARAYLRDGAAARAIERSAPLAPAQRRRRVRRCAQRRERSVVARSCAATASPSPCRGSTHAWRRARRRNRARARAIDARGARWSAHAGCRCEHSDTRACAEGVGARALEDVDREEVGRARRRSSAASSSEHRRPARVGGEFAGASRGRLRESRHRSTDRRGAAIGRNAARLR